MANEFIARKGLIALSDSKVTGSLELSGDLSVVGGDIVLGTTSIFSGGDTTSLNNIDAIDATTEATIEAAIDTLANLTSVQGQTVTLGGNLVTQNNNVTINAVGAARTLTLTESLTVGDGADVTITAVGSARTLTLNESLTVGDGNDGTITFSAASKTLTVEGTSVVNQDLTTDASPQFTGIELGHSSANTLTAGSGVLSIEGNRIFHAGGTDIPVADGGTGASTFTDGGVLLGSGTGAITATAVLANGQLLIGDNSTDPTVAALTGTSNQVTVTNGAGSITLSLPQSIDTSADVTFDSLTLDDLTAGRVVFSGADGLLSDDSDFTFSTDTLTVTKLGAYEQAGSVDFSDEAMTNVNIDSGTITGITDLAVADGGTGASSFTDGYVLLGSGTGAITALNVTADGAMLVGDGSGDPVAESGATLRTSIGVGTGDSPQLTAVNVGHASDTTVARASSGDISVEGNIVYRAGGTNIPVSDGGTGATALTDKAVLISQDSGTDTVGSVALTTSGQLIIGGASGPAAGLITADDGLVVTTGDGTIELDLDLKADGGLVIESNKAAVDLAASSITGTLAVGDGGTGATTLTDGGVLLGNGTGAIVAMNVLTAGQMLVGDGTTDPAVESGATLRTSIGLGATDDVTFDTGSFTGDLTIQGDLVVEGSRTELQVSELKVEDTIITVASGSANSSAANGAGFEIEMGGQTNPAITWDHASQEFDFNYPISGSQISGSYFGDGSGLSNIVSTLNTVGDSGTGAIALKTQTLTVAGGEGIDTVAGSQTVTISGEDATDSNKGIASFNSTNFTVSSGAVTSNNITINGATVTLGGTRNVTLAQITNAGATTTDAVTFSDGAILNGTNNSGSAVSVATGDSETTSVIAQVATGSYQSAHFDYYCQDGTNYRAGTVFAVWKGADGGGTIKYTDFSTPDIGDTSDATFTMDLSAAKARLKFTSSAGTWIVSSSIRAT
jgi:hypothetical protein